MKMAQMCFVVGVVSALSATGLSLAQTYPNQWCFSTPVTPCSNQCGCPVSDTSSDFCSGAVPKTGQTEVPYYYCISSSGPTCYVPGPNNYCGGSVVNCIVMKGGKEVPCGCCGSSFSPPCMNNCWTCTGGCITTDKDGSCGQFFGCSN